MKRSNQLETMTKHQKRYFCIFSKPNLSVYFCLYPFSVEVGKYDTEHSSVSLRRLDFLHSEIPSQFSDPLIRVTSFMKKEHVLTSRHPVVSGLLDAWFLHDRYPPHGNIELLHALDVEVAMPKVSRLGECQCHSCRLSLRC